MDQQKPITFSKRAKITLASIGMLGLVLLLTVSISLQRQEQRSKASTTTTTTTTATPALVQHNMVVSHYTSTTTAPFSTNVTAGNLLIVGVSNYQGAITSISDSKGDTLIPLNSPKCVFSPNECISFYYVKNAIGGQTSFTVNYATASDNTMMIYEFSGLDKTSPLETSVSALGNSTTLNGGNISSTSNNALYFVLGMDNWGGDTIVTPGSGYTLLDGQYDSSSHERLYTSYRISAAGSYPTTYTIHDSSAWAVIGAAFKPATITTCSGLTVATPLQLNKTTVAPGQTITGTITYRNDCSTAYTANDIIIAGRDTANGYKDFSDNATSVTVQPGQTVTVTSTRTITSSDPLGQWYSFGSYKDTSNNWHEDTNKVYFTVANIVPTATPTLLPTATPTLAPSATPVPTCNGLTVATPLKFDKTSVMVGQTITGTISFKNNCTVAYQSSDIIVAARDASGNNKDFTDNVSTIIVQPGQTVTLTASRTITSNDQAGQWYAYGSFMDSNWTWHDDTTKLYFTVVAAPTATPTPAPTAIVIVTATPFPTSVPTATPIVPTNTLAPTATPVLGNTFATINLLLHGIGYGGDSVTPNAQGNMSPLHPQRTVTVDIYDVQNQLVATKQGTVSFNTTSGNFSGNIDLGTQFATGIYTVKVKADKYLRGLVSGIQTITKGQTNAFPSLTLVNGDVNNDNQINIVDYNVILGCYSDLLPPISCNDTLKDQSDLNDDGNVNQYDYNLFVRELTNIGGQ